MPISIFDIFGQPWTLLAVAVLFLLIVHCIYVFSSRPIKWWYYAVPFILAIGAFALDHFINTDSERIKTTIIAAYTAVQNEEVHALERTISTEYSDSAHKNKSVLMARAKNALAKSIVEDTFLKITESEINENNAELKLTARIMIDQKSMAGGFARQMFFKFEVELKKDSLDQWKISKVEIVEMNLQPASWKDISMSGW
jgi:hypothetical protein